MGLVVVWFFFKERNHKNDQEDARACIKEKATLDKLAAGLGRNRAAVPLGSSKPLVWLSHLVKAHP